MTGSADEALAELEARIRASEFHGWMGIELLELGRRAVEVALDVEDRHTNLVGHLHGGMIATVADSATGLAMRTMLEPGRDHVTVQLDLHFLAATRGARIIGRGRVVRAGRRIGYAEADVVDEEGRLVARAAATFLLTDGS